MNEAVRSGIEKAFVSSYQKLRGDTLPHFSVQFYPYTGLRHTIRCRAGHVIIRISDVLSEAPEEVLSALVVILVHKLFRRRAPRAQAGLYHSFINTLEIRHKARRVRAARSRKRVKPADGEVFDLRILFHRINTEYFDSRVQVRTVGWSFKASRRTLGHYDPALNTITLSRWLDHPLVPEFVVEYVLYHEMLHVLFDEENRNGRRQIHHRRFREAERCFKRYEAAQSFIRSNV